MKTTLKGFLFGHYDSRGGTTFIEDSDEAKAKQRYIDSFWLGDDEKDLAKEVAAEDYLGPATIESDEEIEDGQDLEYGEGPFLWVAFEPADPADKGHQGAPGIYHLQFGGECPEGHKESELGEDAFGVVVIRKEEGE